MKRIVTIGGGNGHSGLAQCLCESNFFSKINLQSIVSMSDDGRTTGQLMKIFEDELGSHLPPPGDLRKCLYAISGLKAKALLKVAFETVIEKDVHIASLTIREMCELVKMHKDVLKYMESKNEYFLSFRLPLKKSIQGHKLGNVFMASLYHNFLYDYNYMLRFMHDLVEAESTIIPVTTDRAYIRAILDNGEIIEKQDNIAHAEYSGRIKRLELMQSSHGAKHNFKIDDALLEADYIIISAGDLFSSNISNFIIGGMNSLFRKTNAKIICIGNNTNKGGETSDYTVLDFVLTLEQYLGKQVDVFLMNNKRLELGKKDEKRFKEDISIKGGDYIYLSIEEKQYLQSRSTRVIETDLIDEETLYKHDQEKLAKALREILI